MIYSVMTFTEMSLPWQYRNVCCPIILKAENGYGIRGGICQLKIASRIAALLSELAGYCTVNRSRGSAESEPTGSDRMTFLGVQAINADINYSSSPPASRPAIVNHSIKPAHSARWRTPATAGEITTGTRSSSHLSVDILPMQLHNLTPNPVMSQPA